jgi:post-segregation antitoxin (ccd killing protein)
MKKELIRVNSEIVKEGKPKTKKKGKTGIYNQQVLLRLSPTLKNQTFKLAKKRNVSFSEIVRTALRKELKNLK